MTNHSFVHNQLYRIFSMLLYIALLTLLFSPQEWNFLFSANTAYATGLKQGETIYYFSDCQVGAEANCVPGDNANTGTSALAPKRDLSGFDVNALSTGTQLLFARGGAWTDFNLQLRNLNATPTSPIVFDSYTPGWGGSARPWIKAGGMFYAFEFGMFNDTAHDGGYTIRNLKLDGLGDTSNSWGLWLRNDTRNITIENLEITGFEIAIHMQNGSGVGNTSVTIRNNDIHHNSSIGILGDAIDMVIEGNTFTHNNFSGSAFEHAIYLGGHGSNGVVRNNTLAYNSVVSGVCTGGNLTVHGQWDGLLIEGNIIQQDASEGGCYGISVNSAYDTPEWFRNLIVRSNAIVNLGNCSVCLTSAPGAIVENNVIVNAQATYQAGILIPDRTPGPGDDVDDGASIRDNTMYFAPPHPGSVGVAVGPGAGTTTQSNNLTATSPTELLGVPTETNGWHCLIAAEAPIYGACGRVQDIIFIPLVRK